MTEYEMASLLIGWTNSTEGLLQTFIGLLFAFLIASYLVSSKLTGPMVVIVIGLFTAIEISYILSFWGSASDMASLAVKITEIKTAGSPHLDWIFMNAEAGTFKTLYAVQTAIMALSYLGALVFFFYTRHHPREV